MEKQQREQVERNIQEAKEKLEAEMEAAKHEHQLMMMRQGSFLKENKVVVLEKTAVNYLYYTDIEMKTTDRSTHRAG